MDSLNRLFGRSHERDPNLFPIKPIPIHEKEVAVNPQSESCLFNGLIPAEIRNKIFGYALSEYTKTDNNNETDPEDEIDHNDENDHNDEMDSNDELNSDADYDNESNDEYDWGYELPTNPPRSRYHKNTHYTRPNYEGMKTIDFALLQTCRRIYLEAYHLPYQNKEIVLYHDRGPPTSTVAHHQWMEYFSEFEPWQLDLIKEVHLFVQAFWLEDTFSQAAKHDVVSGIQSLRITMRRGDWWYWEHNVPLALSPQSGTIVANSMHQEWAMERNGTAVSWNPDAWGSAFAHMKGLKQLELEFETSDDKKNELKDLVIHALSWKFPAYSQTEGIEMVLSADEFEPKWDSWQGPMCYWSNNCPYCERWGKCSVTDPPNEGCAERTKLKAEEKGPLCHVVRLEFKIARKNTRD